MIAAMPMQKLLSLVGAAASETESEMDPDMLAVLERGFRYIKSKTKLN